MSRTIIGHFDGRVIVPEKPVKLPIGRRLRIQVAVDRPKKNGKPAVRPVKIIGTGQFRSGIADLATNKRYMEGFGKS